MHHNSRRRFTQSALGLIGLPMLGLAGCTTAPLDTKALAATSRTLPPDDGLLPLIKPPRLKRGEIVGLIAPGGYADDSMIQRSVKNIESLGVKVKLGANLRARHGGYAGTRFERLADLHAMFSDQSVAGIWTVRGGSGGSALLPLIDYELIRKNAKILVGFSDITALHLAIQKRARIVTFHGPAGISTFSDYAVAQLRAVLMEPQANHVMSVPAEQRAKASSDPLQRTRRVNLAGSGIAVGAITGGNLAVVASLVGTPYAARYENALLFLEDVGEAPYRIDRLLTQLDQSTPFAKAAGVMLGVFQRTTVPDGEYTLNLDQIANEHFAALKIPVASGFSVGHIANQYTLPMGVRARLDADAQTLTLLETAVL